MRPYTHGPWHEALRRCAEALRNVPPVGETYDEQHSATQLRAETEARALLALFEERDAIEEDGTSGQDRESYTDTQDRESYS